MSGKRRFGRVRQLPSGRWQARYKGPDGIDRPAPHTFRSKTSAERWLAVTEVDIIHGDWLDPDAGRELFRSYATAWVDERPGLRPKTIQLYRYLLRAQLVPMLGNQGLTDITEVKVRAWRKNRLDAGASPITVAKAYRLLKAIMNTAVDDGAIRRNPCRIKGAGQEHSPERPVLSLGQVYALADAIGPQYRAMVLLAVFASLRWGELIALRRRDLNLVTRAVHVTRQLTEVSGNLAFGPLKSPAGRRIVMIPDLIVPELTWHLEHYALPGDDTLVFTSPEGKPLRHSAFRRRTWLPALAQAELSLVHFHDLRHTGNDLAGDTGATLRELMDRMGHSTARAALIYQHGKQERQQAIADAINERATAEIKVKRSGTQRARKPPRAS